MALLGFSWDATFIQDAMFGCDQYEGGFNMVKYCNEELDEINAEAKRTFDEEARRELLIEASNIVNDESAGGGDALLQGDQRLQRPPAELQAQPVGRRSDLRLDSAVRDFRHSQPVTSPSSLSAGRWEHGPAHEKTASLPARRERGWGPAAVAESTTRYTDRARPLTPDLGVERNADAVRSGPVNIVGASRP